MPILPIVSKVIEVANATIVGIIKERARKKESDRKKRLDFSVRLL